MKVLITGGAGFIGSNLVRRLNNDEFCDVVVLDDLSTGDQSNLDGLDLEFLEGSILDESILKKAASGTDCIVHLAARPSVALSIAEPLVTNAVNSVGTLYVLEAAREARAHVTLASSSAVYGNHTALPLSEELPPLPISPYAASKLAAEAYGLSYQAAYGVPVLPLRFFNVYGPGQTAGHAYASVIPSFLEAALKGQALKIHGDGSQTRDFVFVDTVTDIISKAIQRRTIAKHGINLALSERHSLLSVIGIIEELMKSPLEREFTAPRAGDIKDSMAATSELRSLFPDIEPIALEEGIARTLSWFQR